MAWADFCKKLAGLSRIKLPDFFVSGFVSHVLYVRSERQSLDALPETENSRAIEI